MRWARLAALALALVWAGHARAATEDTRCVVDGISGPVVTAQEGETLHPLLPGERLSGVRAVVTADGARARLVFPGWSAIVGPATRIEVGVPGTPVVLVYGSLRLNRPGDPSGPAVVLGSRLVNVHVPGDGRALVTIARGTRRVPDTMRAIALRGTLTLAPHKATLASQLPEGAQATGAGSIPVARWAVKQLSPAERADLERNSLMKAERAQLAGKLPLIPHDTLRLDGAPLAQNRTMYLSRADVPPEGRVALTGLVRLDRVPPSLGEIYVAASLDGGQTWDRLKWRTPSGDFVFEFVPQDQVEYSVQLGVFQVAGAKLYETTSAYPMTYRESFLPALSDFKVCGQPVPESGTLTIYSDELTDFAVVLEGIVRCDAPLSRVCVEVSPDAGVRWRRATLVPAAAKGEPSAGAFRVAFTPVPGAGYRFRVRTTYAQGTEKIRPHQVLSDWDATAIVKYSDQRSVERIAALVHELETALKTADQAKVRALLSPQFNLRDRDIAHPVNVRFTPGQSAREAGTQQIAVDWARTDASGESAHGHAIFLYVKQTDFALVEILGDDPLSPQTGRPADASEVREIALPLDSVFDVQSHRTHPYDPRAIPDDVAFYRDDEGQPVLGTHDRRLAILGETTFANATLPHDRLRLECKASVIPQDGAILYLKTRQGAETILEVREAGGFEGRAPRVKLAYRLVEP